MVVRKYEIRAFIQIIILFVSGQMGQLGGGGGGGGGGGEGKELIIYKVYKMNSIRLDRSSQQTLLDFTRKACHIVEPRFTDRCFTGSFSLDGKFIYFLLHY